MKNLVVGLGNPGAEYHKTRHNIGFDILDAWAEKEGFGFKPDRLGDVAEFRYKGRKVIAVKPSTYMNLSGKAVRYWMDKTKVINQNVMVITDDLNLDLGKIRMRAKGSNGGHNGLRNVEQILGASNYPRLRFGIGNDFTQSQQVDFVLSRWLKEEEPTVEKNIERCIEAVQCWIFRDIQAAMSQYNG